MIVWSEKKGNKRQRLVNASCNIREIKNEEMGKTAPTIIESPNYQSLHNPERGNIHL